MRADRYLEVFIADQQLVVWQDGGIVKTYPVSTAKNGPGERMGSECTPTGWHRIRAKIGAGQPINSVFVGRRPTGEVYSAELARQYPRRDWILSRILWLNGMEPGKNRYGRVDSGWRYIYIHGCPDHLLQGRPESHGCIRMKNTDVIELFERVAAGCPVFIHR
ncbi:L,D-transpeptidase [Methylomarinum sp. Ch1-1]|uniref:L,D-transpeptidase n=1 Tax=Methylomarinum roseum TaxID=3067653 RepID=A0AAU7NZZ6_9GAMM|nr:L,D-transpeptidase [Methylomarinum sp. Ch1-1]MDP4521051.1 L,D-transpeptidase [Methylomarinum sp. Ch1-1]